MLDESIDISKFLYRKYFTIVESLGNAYTDIQIYIRLTSDNFDFTKINSDGSDLRFSLDIDGRSSLYYWISDMDYINELCSIWIELPLLYRYESKIVYVFFGNTSSEAVSNLNNLNFIFSYLFDYSPLNNYIFDGTINNTLASYGYYMGSSSTSQFYTKTNIFNGHKTWDLFTNIYVTGYLSLDIEDRFAHDITTIGDENPLQFNFFSNIYTRHNIINNTLNEYSIPYSGFESGSYNLYNISYKEATDRVYFSIKQRNTYPDYNIDMERCVMGNTSISDIKFTGDHQTDYSSYIKYILICKYYMRDIEIDLSFLQAGAADVIGEIVVDDTIYNTDLTDVDYYHESSCGGIAEYLSNNNNGSGGTYWESNLNTSSGYILIDFARNNYNLVNEELTHIDSGHAYRCGAVRLSNNENTTYPFFISKQTTGWIAIDFDGSPKIVRVLCLQGDASDGMIDSFVFKGSYDDPISSTDDWSILFEGNCRKVSDWQMFYINNYNKYRYYKIEVLSTFGEVIKMRNWEMYESTDLNTVNGVKVDQLRLLPSLYQSNAVYFPKQIVMYGTNDYITWDTLSQVYTFYPLSEGLYSYWQRFDLVTTKKYIVYKLEMINNWGDNDKFIIDGWELVNNYREAVTYRVLTSETLNIKSIWADKLTTFDSGWIFSATDTDVYYIYNDYLAKTESITSIIDLIQ